MLSTSHFLICFIFIELMGWSVGGYGVLNTDKSTIKLIVVVPLAIKYILRPSDKNLPLKKAMLTDFCDCNCDWRLKLVMVLCVVYRENLLEYDDNYDIGSSRSFYSFFFNCRASVCLMAYIHHVYPLLCLLTLLIAAEYTQHRPI